MYSDIPNENFFKQLKENDLKKYGDTFKDNLSEDQKKGLQEFLKYLHNEFINDENYSISATLTHEAFYSKHALSTDILIYPSVQSNKIGTNFAVHPNIADNMLELQRLYIVEINNYIPDNNKFSLTFMNFGEVVDNKIRWYNFPASDVKFREFINEDFTGIVEK